MSEEKTMGKTGRVDSEGREEVSGGGYTWFLPTQAEAEASAAKLREIFPPFECPNCAELQHALSLALRYANPADFLYACALADRAAYKERAETAEQKLKQVEFLCGGLAAENESDLRKLETAERERDQLKDNPELDATDFAHPAFFRGEQYGGRGTVELILRTLDGDSGGTCSNERLQLARDRITTLLWERDQAREELAALKKPRPSYILFTYNSYYPNGGNHDFAGQFNTVDDAKSAYDGKYEGCHISEFFNGNMHVVWEGYSGGWSNPASFKWAQVGEVAQEGQGEKK